MNQWHEKFRRLRQGRQWSLREAAQQLVAASPLYNQDQVETARQQIIRWERGNVSEPDSDNKAAIARMFDLPLRDFWPDRPLANNSIPDRLAPDEFSDLVGALQMPSVGRAHLDQAEQQVERLCSEYAYADATSLNTEVTTWLRDLTTLVRDGRVDYAGHGQVLRLVGWLSLLRSCLMYDLDNDAASAEACTAAEQMAHQLSDTSMEAWTWEIRAWKALTRGDMVSVIAAADAGLRINDHASIAAQLHAQKAKAYARLRDNHKTEVALEQVRHVLDTNTPPTNPRNHFVVDPTKASFYAMDAYRVLKADPVADSLAETVIQTSTTPSGAVLSPMRLAEAQLTRGLVLARAGDVDGAVSITHAALAHERRSAPSLLMVAQEVAQEITRTHPETGHDFAQHLRAIGAA